MGPQERVQVAEPGRSIAPACAPDALSHARERVPARHFVYPGRTADWPFTVNASSQLARGLEALLHVQQPARMASSTINHRATGDCWPPSGCMSCFRADADALSWLAVADETARALKRELKVSRHAKVHGKPVMDTNNPSSRLTELARGENGLSSEA